MNLELNAELAVRYKKLPQQARVMTEAWAEENLYCPSCPSDNLEPQPTGKQVIDFTCSKCEENFQLKSHSRPFGKRVANSAYHPKIQALRRGTIPHYLFLHYDRSLFRVKDLFAVPKHFMSESMIERRKKLSKKARRSGWIGSNILLGNLPLDARISIVGNGQEVPKHIVRDIWKQFSFLRDQSLHSRGWLSDVLACVRELESETFSLSDMYTFETRLAKLHPINKHVHPKIRQQLQVLRNNDIIEFLGKGTYRIKKF